MEKKRLDWLDVSKAFGVYLVILGHLVLFNYRSFRFIFAFHMPFFFLSAGYVWKMVPWKTFFKKSCKYYLIPYVTVLILGFLQCLLIPLPGHDITSFLQPEALEKTFYHGHPCFSFFGSAWFLLAMFWAQLLFYGMNKIACKSKKYITVLLWIVIVLFAVFSKGIFSQIPLFERLPLKMDSALMATVFLGIGALLKKTGILEKGKWYLSVVYIIAGAFFTWLFGCRWNYYVNLCDLDYAREYNYIIAAVAGSIMLFGMGQLLQGSRILRFMGKNTLVIFLSHEAIYLFLMHWINRIFKKAFTSQSMVLDVWSIGISVGTLFLATFLAWIFSWMKKRIKGVGKKEHKQ